MRPASRGLSCSLVTVDERLEREWDELALATRSSPFVRPGWTRAWAGAFAPRRPLLALAVRRRAELVGLVPVIASRGALRAPVNAETPAFDLLGTGPEAVAALVPLALSRARAIDIRFLPTSSHERTFVAAAEETKARVLRRQMRRSPFVNVDGDWEVLRAQALPRSRVKWLRRMHRQLAAAGAVTFEAVSGAAALGGLLEEGLALEASGWKGAQGTAVLSRPGTASFYRSVARWAADAELLRLFALRVDGRLIAFEYALEQYGTVHVMKTAHSPDHRRFGPGILSQDLVLAHAAGQPGVTVVELLGEDEPYKLEVASGVREQLHVQVFAPTPSGRLAAAAAEAVAAARNEARRRVPPGTRARLLVTAGALRRRPRLLAARVSRCQGSAA